MKIAVYTQCRENYGDAENPHWKFKGGSDYIVARCLSYQQVADLGRSGLQAIVNKALPIIEQNGDMYCEWIIDWDLLEDNEPTENEALQNKYCSEEYAYENFVYLAHDVSIEVHAA